MLAQGLCENRAAGKFNTTMHSRANRIRLMNPDDCEQYITLCRRTAVPNSVHCRPLRVLIGPLLSNSTLHCRPIVNSGRSFQRCPRVLAPSLLPQSSGSWSFWCYNCDDASHETLPPINLLLFVSGRLPDYPGVRVRCFEDALPRSRCGQPPDAIPVPEGGKEVSYRINV